MKTPSSRTDRINSVYSSTDMYQWAMKKAEADIIFIMIGMNDVGIINQNYGDQIKAEDKENKTEVDYNEDFYNFTQSFIQLPNKPWVYTMTSPPIITNRLKDKNSEVPESNYNGILAPHTINVTKSLFPGNSEAHLINIFALFGGTNSDGKY